MINGPVISGTNMSNFKMREMVMVGDNKLIGEVIILDGENGTIQVYEETEGLRIGEEIVSTEKPLSVKLGPGMLGNMFDGIQRPLLEINKINKNYIPEGIGLISIDEERLWSVEMLVSVGDQLNQGDIFGVVQETSLIKHKLLVPPGVSGLVTSIVKNGFYNIEEVLLTLEDNNNIHELKMYHEWPVREPRPCLLYTSIEFEIKDIFTIIESKRYQMPANEVSKYLIRTIEVK